MRVQRGNRTGKIATGLRRLCLAEAFDGGIALLDGNSRGIGIGRHVGLRRAIAGQHFSVGAGFGLHVGIIGRVTLHLGVFHLGFGSVLRQRRRCKDGGSEQGCGKNTGLGNRSSPQVVSFSVFRCKETHTHGHELARSAHLVRFMT